MKKTLDLLVSVSLFHSVQSLSRVGLFVTPSTAACQVSLGWAKYGSFSNGSALCIRWPKYYSFSFSIKSSNEYSGKDPDAGKD